MNIKVAKWQVLTDNENRTVLDAIVFEWGHFEKKSVPTYPGFPYVEESNTSVRKDLHKIWRRESSLLETH